MEEIKKTHVEKYQLIRKKELQKLLNVSDSTIYRLEANGDLPKRIRLGGKVCAWFLTEIREFLEAKAAARGSE